MQQRQSSNVHGPGHSGHFTDTIWRQFIQSPAKSYALFAFIFLLLVGALISTRLLDSTALGGGTNKKLRDRKGQTDAPDITKKHYNKTEYPLKCTDGNNTKTCPGTYPTSYTPEEDHDSPLAPTCPDYFRWIHEDLRPWARTGITREMVERANETANFRLVIVKGRAYVKRNIKAFQSRDTFTLWGILQLLRRYPGKIPDLDLMFDCVDWPILLKSNYSVPGAPAPPPLFRYCANDQTFDIVFPDWSFWGWPEVNIKSWGKILKDLEEGNRRMNWTDREPYAYWKGNPVVASSRQDLMKCNVSEGQEWNARLYDWKKEKQKGYKQSDLASQCKHRFKIYIEGSAWSVSEKYILACDSVTLYVTPNYTDFFTRGLIPMHHFWPINVYDKCRSIKFAVDWGNNHTGKAQEIGRAASRFIQEELKMDYVYDYMFHLLNQYSKLFRYQPTIPTGAVEYCAETMACPEEGMARKLMEESLETSPKETSPCTLPPPYDPSSLYDVLREKENSILQVESWVKAYWENQTNQS
ncbi:CAP10 domain-containing protein [Citrus sinensis]|nr:CAP10 domain-containing protein [Citrus sinensis]